MILSFAEFLIFEVAFLTSFEKNLLKSHLKILWQGLDPNLTRILWFLVFDLKYPFSLVNLWVLTPLEGNKRCKTNTHILNVVMVRMLIITFHWNIVLVFQSSLCLILNNGVWVCTSVCVCVCVCVCVFVYVYSFYVLYYSTLGRWVWRGL